MKKVCKALCLLLAAIMILSLSACRKPTPVMFTYTDMTMSSGMYAFALAERKGYIANLYSSYGQDISSDEEFWNAPLGDSTNGEWLKDYAEELCKNILLVNYFCKEYDLKITDETAIQELDGYIEKAKETFGGEDELALELAEYGITIEQLREYYEYFYKYQLLLDYWYGENGTMKIPETEVREKFFGGYYKADMAMFSFYTTDENNNTVAFVDKTITDEQAKDYFGKNFVKVKQIVFMTVDEFENPLSEEEAAKSEKDAKDTYEAILNGTVDYDAKMKEKSDASAELVFTRGEVSSEVETAAFEMKNDEVKLVQSKYGWHIIKKIAVTDDDFEKKADDVKEAMSKEKVAASAKEMFEKLKENKIEFKEGGENALYKFVSGRVLPAEGTDQNIINAISSINSGEYTLYEYKSGDETQGYYIFKRVDLDENDLQNYYSTVEDSLKEAKYFDYIKTYYDSVTVNQDELAKYDNVPAVKSFPSLTY